MGYYLIFLAIAFLFSWILISLFQFLANRYKLLSNPKERILKPKTLPLLGGAPLCFGFILTLLLFLLWQPKDYEFSLLPGREQLLAMLIGIAIVSLVGLVHDIHSLSSIIRISFHIVATALLIAAQIRTELVFMEFGKISVGPFYVAIGNAVVTLIWVLLVIKLFDVLEVFDGLIVGIAIMAGIFLFAIAILGYDYRNAFLCLVFTGTLLGIFWDQLPPATISLGKMGSSFIGFTLAALTLSLNYSSQHTIAVCIPVLLLAPILIVGLFLGYRAISGRDIPLQQIWTTLEKRGIKSNKLLAFSVMASFCMGAVALLIFTISSKTFSSVLLMAVGIIIVFITIKLFQVHFENT